MPKVEAEVGRIPCPPSVGNPGCCTLFLDCPRKTANNHEDRMGLDFCPTCFVRTLLLLYILLNLDILVEFKKLVLFSHYHRTMPGQLYSDLVALDPAFAEAFSGQSFYFG